MIAMEESNVNTKNAMLDYFSEIMEDGNDYSWQSAKASHAILSCRMEGEKLNGLRPPKLIGLDVLKAQRLPSQSSNTSNKS